MVSARIPALATLLLSLLLLSNPASAEVSVSLDRNPVEVNESFQLVFTLDQTPDTDPDFSPLLRDFVILGNNRSSNISIINGQYERNITWTVQLMARAEGEFEIPAIHFDRERSTPISITVNPATPSPLSRNQIALEMRADRSEAYVQSQIVLTLRLSTAADLSPYQFGNVAIDSIDTVIEPLGDVRQYQTRVDGKAYLVLEKQFALFPQQTGRLEIAPVMAEVRLPSRRSFDPFRNGGEVRRFRSEAVAIDIKPIPGEYDAAYWLPARRLELRQQWQGDLAALVAGEPVTRSLTIVADGLTAAQLPELPFAPIDGVKQYPDQPKLENQQVGEGIRGIREQKVALIPGSAGRYLVPPVSLPWWNLETGQVEVATLPARDIVVLSPAEGALPASGSATAETTGTAEAVNAAGASGASDVPVAESPPAGASGPWPWLSLALACGWALSLLYWWFVARRPAPAPDSRAPHRGLADARRALQQACQADDAAGARRALLAWGQALLAPRRIGHLGQLCAVLGDAFEREVEMLNLSRYSRDRGGWRGDALWRLCREIERRHSADEPAPGDGLGPLNPA